MLDAWGARGSVCDSEKPPRSRRESAPMIFFRAPPAASCERFPERFDPRRVRVREGKILKRRGQTVTEEGEEGGEGGAGMRHEEGEEQGCDVAAQLFFFPLLRRRRAVASRFP
eukprot:5323924-Pyramimonas_sp.AAC.1